MLFPEGELKDSMRDVKPAFSIQAPELYAPGTRVKKDTKDILRELQTETGQEWVTAGGIIFYPDPQAGPLYIHHLPEQWRGVLSVISNFPYELFLGREVHGCPPIESLYINEGQDKLSLTYSSYVPSRHSSDDMLAQTHLYVPETKILNRFSYWNPTPRSMYMTYSYRLSDVFQGCKDRKSPPHAEAP